MWANNLQIYIEPKTRQAHREAIRESEGVISHYGYQIIDDLAEIYSEELPLIIVFEEDNNKELEILKKRPGTFLIQFYQANLDLFQTQNIEEDGFIVESGDELRQTIENINQLIVLGLNHSMHEQVSRPSRELKLLSSRKSKSELRDFVLSQKQKEYGEQLYEQSNLLDIISYVHTHSKEVWGITFQVFKIEELLREDPLPAYLPLQVSQDLYFFLTWKGEASTDEILANYQILQECLINHGVVYDSILERERKELVLSSLTLPIVIFDENNDILIHNHSFIHLNLGVADCLSLQNGDQITLKRSIYRVIKSDIGHIKTKLVFIPVNDFILESKNPSFEELGIISSSIAHELNNPLAGVSAALDLLLLDDFEESILEELRLMKKGVNRCRSLVETFLGFSRSVNHISGKVNMGESDLEKNIEQALELIRFRLIENNINIQFQYTCLNKLVKNVNPHVMTMFFYLFFGDIVTTMSHTSLVTRNKLGHLKVNLSEDVDRLRISYSDEIAISRSFSDSKLVLHLLDVLSFRFEQNESLQEITLL